MTDVSAEKIALFLKQRLEVGEVAKPAGEMRWKMKFAGPRGQIIRLISIERED